MGDLECAISVLLLSKLAASPFGMQLASSKNLSEFRSKSLDNFLSPCSQSNRFVCYLLPFIFETIFGLVFIITLDENLYLKVPLDFFLQEMPVQMKFSIFTCLEVFWVIILISIVYFYWNWLILFKNLITLEWLAGRCSARFDVIRKNTLCFLTNLFTSLWVK